MNAYAVVVFVHVLGAIGLFAALALEWASLARLGRAQTAEQARSRLAEFEVLRWVGAPALVVTLLTALYLASTWEWGPAWLRAAVPSLLLLPLFGAAITGRRLGALARALPEAGELGAELQPRLRDPLLWLSLRARLGVLVGIVFLMEVKPAGHQALMAMGVALGAGLASSAPAWRRARAGAPA